MTIRSWCRATALPGLVALMTTPVLAQQAPSIDPARYAALSYRHIGPEGNRVSSVAGVVGDPMTYYAGAASGGLWKTTDGAISWVPIFDGQPVASIGALAVAPSDPNVVWAGTGEPFIRSHISVGWGMYRSTDAGKSWTKMGLDKTGRIARIVIHPTNPDVVLVAALGHAYGPQPERGIYRTTDGGQTWQRTLFVNDSTGAIDLVMDPSNPRILYAATWQIEIHTWGRTSGGAGSGIWKSTDGGVTWARLTGNGLPTKHFGKVGLGISPANPDRVYALIETSDGVPFPGLDPETGELWRSENGGASWAVVSHDRELAARTHYYTRMAVQPDDADEAWFMAANATKTLDGGKTTVDLPFEANPGWDHHDMWIDPTNGNRMVVGSDCCVSVSNNRGRSWIKYSLPIAQMYHVTADNQVPYWVYSNRQDGPSARGPSNSKIAGFFGSGQIPRSLWTTVGGGESGWATPDPEDPNLVWSSASGSGGGGGIVVRYDVKGSVGRNVEVWPESPLGAPAEGLKYRFVWSFPLVISPHDRNTVYVGSQHVHRTTNGGQSWDVISPDLTLNDKSRQVISGGLTPDNIGVEYAGVVFAIAESPLERGLLWAGTNDGKVHVTRDGGANWTDLTGNLPGLISWGTINNIEASHYDAGTAYLTVDGHQANNRDPWVYRTTDYGRSWTLIVTGLEKNPLSYAHVVREDPVRRGLLYLGTEGGLYVSFDNGGHWQPMQGNLPHAPVYDMVIQREFNDLVVATYGRGIWILDDLSPMQQLTPEVAGRDVHLFSLRQAWRYKLNEGGWGLLPDPIGGANPAYGADINYWLGKEPADSAVITIANQAGQVVRTLTGSKTVGVNRVMWDLDEERTTEVTLRTSPLFAPEILVGPKGRRAPDFGRRAVQAPPGRYTVRLKVGGVEQSTELVVRKDPLSGGSEAGIVAQTGLVREITTDLNQAATMVNRLEVMRAQLAVLNASLPSDDADLKAGADSLEQLLLGVEEELVQLRLTGRGQDGIRFAPKLAGKLNYLAGGLTGSDDGPTDQQREVQVMLRRQLMAVQQRFDALKDAVMKFNTRLQSRGVAGVIAAP